MTDVALKNALTRKDELALKVSALKQELDAAVRALSDTEGFINAWYEFANVSAPESNRIVENVPDTSRLLSQRKRHTKTTGNPSKEQVVEAVLSIIHNVRSPVPRAMLLEELELRGIKLAGVDPDKVLSTMLWRMPQKIVRLPRFGYWDVALPYAQAGYMPQERDPDEEANNNNDDAFLFRAEPQATHNP